MKNINTKKEKYLLSKRYKVEHTNNLLLNYNRVQTRFDKYINNYASFIYLTCANMISKFLHS